MAQFVLHPQLSADTHFVADLTLSRFLLMDNSLVPWVILVPRENGLREIIDLKEEDQMQLMQEISLVSRALVKTYAPDKINTAALGNQVPQLHIHVLARFEKDPAWPKPVWGNLPAKPYTTQEAAAAKAMLHQAISFLS